LVRPEGDFVQSNRLTLVAPLSILLVASSVNYACTNDGDDNPTVDAGVYIDGGIQYGVPPGSGATAPAGGDDTTGDDASTSGDDASTGPGTDGSAGTDGSTTRDGGTTSPTGTAFAALVLGDGKTTIDGTATTTNVANIEYFKADGTLVKTITLPSANATGALTVASSSLDGEISRSANGTYLLVGGYDLDPQETIAGGGIRRIGRLDASGTPDISTEVSGLSSSENFRGVASADGVTLFAAGSVSGIQKVTFQGTTSTKVSAIPADSRGLNVYGSALYAGAGSSPSYGLFSTPVAAPTTLTLLSGWTVSGGKPAPTQSAGFDSNGDGTIDVIYAADETLGVQKWTSSNGTAWTLAGTFGSTAGAISVAASVSGATATLFFTVFTSVSNTTVWTVTDTLSGGTATGTPTKILSGTATTSYRGLALPPSGV
jgi:hypothetical protein